MTCYGPTEWVLIAALLTGLKPHYCSFKYQKGSSKEEIQLFQIRAKKSGPLHRIFKNWIDRDLAMTNMIVFKTLSEKNIDRNMN